MVSLMRASIIIAAMAGVVFMVWTDHPWFAGWFLVVIFVELTGDNPWLK